ncbi:MAG: phosphoribosylglycinamide formyltransferase [Ignavibacteria bacterium]|nr:phosphoribosylglycinamide formyltransferase [Ignavibacteria bacterium]MBK7033939.1 phosphoribosylglycinamide formyltransferase [Ignavibacteria bacterium]MBK7411904.1 phosphoribosylglycinamide formyltransferase [Ignavibacteria bacterium]
MGSTTKVRIAILGSGTGSNAKALCEAAKSSESAFSVALVLTTSSAAGMCEVARGENVDLEVIPASVKGEEFSTKLCSLLEQYRIDVLVLAGFMRLVSTKVLTYMSGHVVNIHPALLPEFGGQGMYGLHVHEAVLASGRTETGATVHVVTEQYDEGAMIGQTKVPVFPEDSPSSLQQRVKETEHKLYPVALNHYIRENFQDIVGSVPTAGISAVS